MTSVMPPDDVGTGIPAPARRDVHPWLGGAFQLEGAVSSALPLRQETAEEFSLPRDLRIRYTKATGLEQLVARGAIDQRTHDQIRVLDPADVERFDLASVPGPLRWFARSYGAYTPAAIFHDRLIVGDDEEHRRLIADVHADRYFRFMLAAVGVPRLKRYVMWTATAMRTRWAAGPATKALLIVWLLLAAAGIAAFVTAALDLAFGTGVPFASSAWLLPLSLVTPIAASALWGRQYGAGLVAAIAALWILPPAIFAAIGYGVYRMLEWLASQLFDDQPPASADQAMRAATKRHGQPIGDAA